MRDRKDEKTKLILGNYDARFSKKDVNPKNTETNICR